MEADTPHEGGVAALPDGFPLPRSRPVTNRLYALLRKYCRGRLPGGCEARGVSPGERQCFLLLRVGEEFYVEALQWKVAVITAKYAILYSCRLPTTVTVPSLPDMLPGSALNSLCLLWCYGFSVRWCIEAPAGYGVHSRRRGCLRSFAEQPSDHLRKVLSGAVGQSRAFVCLVKALVTRPSGLLLPCAGGPWLQAS